MNAACGTMHKNMTSISYTTKCKSISLILEFESQTRRIVISSKMPKPKESKSVFIARMLSEYPGVFRADDSVLFCKYCSCTVNADKTFLVSQHVGTARHKKAVELRNGSSSKSQTLLTEFKQPPKMNEYNADLCKALLDTNIPLYKVNHPSFSGFLEKYTKKSTPSETVLRQKYVPSIYDDCIEKLRSKAEKNYIWVSIDETTDVDQRMVANFIFGVLDGEEKSEERGKCYLLNMTVMDVTNANSMAAFFNDSLALLWPKGVCLNMIENAALFQISFEHYLFH